MSRDPYAEFVANTAPRPRRGVRTLTTGRDAGSTQTLPASVVTEGTASEEFPIQRNVFPYSQPAVTTQDRLGGSLARPSFRVAVLWVADDPKDDELNRTEIEYSFSDGTSWSAPQYISDDSVSDFRPQVIPDGNGNLLAAWERANTTLTQFESRLVFLTLFSGMMPTVPGLILQPLARDLLGYGAN